MRQLMVVLQLFPSGVLQLLDVLNNGYFHARGPAFLDQPLSIALAWARLPVDITFTVAGVVPMLVATLLTYIHARKANPNTGAV